MSYPEDIVNMPVRLSRGDVEAMPGISSVEVVVSWDCKHAHIIVKSGFIQESLSKIQGLFKDFSRLFYSFQ